MPLAVLQRTVGTAPAKGQDHGSLVRIRVYDSIFFVVDPGTAVLPIRLELRLPCLAPRVNARGVIARPDKTARDGARGRLRVTWMPLAGAQSYTVYEAPTNI